MKTTFFVFKNGLGSDYHLRLGLNSAESVPLTDLVKGENYLGGQTLRVFENEDGLWLAQIEGSMFEADPRTFAYGFKMGVRTLRCICLKVANWKNPPQAQIISYPYPVFCHVEEPTTGMFVLKGLSGHQTCLNTVHETAGRGPFDLAIPGQSTAALRADVNGKTLIMWSRPNAVILSSSYLNLEANYWKSLEICFLSKAQKKVEEDKLLNLERFRNIPAIILADALLT